MWGRRQTAAAGKPRAAAAASLLPQLLQRDLENVPAVGVHVLLQGEGRRCELSEGTPVPKEAASPPNAAQPRAATSA